MKVTTSFFFRGPDINVHGAACHYITNTQQGNNTKLINIGKAN